jgi:hypothetical protein
MPLTTIATSYFNRLMHDKPYQIVIPQRRINFLRHNDQPKVENKVCTFPTVWITLGMERYLGPRQIIHRKTHTY